MRLLQAAFLVSLALSVPGTACGQLSSLPVSIYTKEAAGLKDIVVSGSFGIANHDTKAFAGSMIFSPGRISIQMGGGGLFSRRQDGYTIGASLGAGIVPPRGSKLKAPAVVFQPGIGYTNQGRNSTVLDIPLALGVFWSLPILKVNFDPWAALQVHIRTAEDTIAGSATDVGFGMSSGINLTSSKGFGVCVAGELLNIENPLTRKKDNEFSFAFGLRWRFTFLRTYL